MSVRTLKRANTVSLLAVLSQLSPWVLTFGLFAAVGIMHVGARVLVVDAGYRLSKLEAENRELMRKSDSLKVELATLQSPSRLERLARKDLQMSPPLPGAVITLRDAPAERVSRKGLAQRTPGNVAGGRLSGVGGSGPSAGGALVAQGRRGEVR